MPLADSYDCQHRNIVILTKLLRRVCNRLGTVSAHGDRALKSEQLARLAASLDYTIGHQLSGRVLGALSHDVVLGLFCAGPDMKTLPIVPRRHRSARRLLPKRLVMRPRSVRNERVDRFPKFHGVDERLRVMTGSHTATVSRLIAVRADGFLVSFLENCLLIGRDGPVFGRRRGTEDERDQQSFHVKASCHFYTAGDQLGFSTFGSLLLYFPWPEAREQPRQTKGFGQTKLTF
jgi:hypothetical protein